MTSQSDIDTRDTDDIDTETHSTEIDIDIEMESVEKVVEHICPYKNFPWDGCDNFCYKCKNYFDNDFQPCDCELCENYCKTDGIGCECESDRLYEEELENEKRALQKRLDEESHDCEMCCKCGEFITIDPNCIHCKYHGHVCYCKIICDQCGYSGNDCNCY